MANKKRSVSYYLSDDVASWLEEKAKQHYRSRSKMLELILREVMKNDKK